MRAAPQLPNHNPKSWKWNRFAMVGGGGTHLTAPKPQSNNSLRPRKLEAPPVFFSSGAVGGLRIRTVYGLDGFSSSNRVARLNISFAGARFLISPDSCCAWYAAFSPVKPVTLKPSKSLHALKPRKKGNLHNEKETTHSAEPLDVLRICGRVQDPEGPAGSARLLLDQGIASGAGAGR